MSRVPCVRTDGDNESRAALKAFTVEDYLTVGPLASQWRRSMGAQGSRGILTLLSISKLHYIALRYVSIRHTNHIQYELLL